MQLVPVGGVRGVMCVSCENKGILRRAFSSGESKGKDNRRGGRSQHGGRLGRAVVVRWRRVVSFDYCVVVCVSGDESERERKRDSDMAETLSPVAVGG